ncbi:hypothetical protein [Winogradskyella sp.]|uniref:hypothetical protein n=1 Tax=Winogradskyella sp. TaxID=1883156 RepID=UPI003AB7AACD
MDELDNYYNFCIEIATEMWPEYKNPRDYCHVLYNEQDERFKEMLKTRSVLLDDNDYNKNGGLLGLGFFNGVTDDEKLACYCIVDDITSNLTYLDFEKRFEQYNKEHAIFNNVPNLWDEIRKSEGGKLDLELIKLSSLERINKSEVVTYENKYFKFDYALNPNIVDWSETNFDSNSIYVRLDPHEYHEEQPVQRFFESILQPANPDWWKELNIRHRGHEGSAYLLDDCDPRENLEQYWEKHIKRVVRLEIKANRGPDGLLSMLLEEITSIDNNGLMINRVIHMDTDAPYGTRFNETTLKHLDIAVYVYKDHNAQKRMNTNINKGIRSDDADYKCHLLRIDNIPFKSVFGISYLFLKSKTLLFEWLKDQFDNLNDID